MFDERARMIHYRLCYFPFSSLVYHHVLVINVVYSHSFFHALLVSFFSYSLLCVICAMQSIPIGMATSDDGKQWNIIFDVSRTKTISPSFAIILRNMERRSRSSIKLMIIHLICSNGLGRTLCPCAILIFVNGLLWICAKNLYILKADQNEKKRLLRILNFSVFVNL